MTPGRRLRAVIVDDEPAGRRTLVECCGREPDIDVLAEYGDPLAALAAIQAEPPDLLFLDVQMEPCTGLALARALDPATLPLLVFVTAFDRYAVDAFDLSATDYLLKPFDSARFRKALDRVRARCAVAETARRAAALDELLTRLGSAPTAEPARLLAEAHGQLHLLDARQIELVEADRNYVRIRVGRESYHARSTLQQAEIALTGQPVLRISRSCVVNTAHLRQVSRTPRGDFILVLAGGATVTSSEGYRDRVREYLDALRLDR